MMSFAVLRTLVWLTVNCVVKGHEPMTYLLILRQLKGSLQANLQINDYALEVNNLLITSGAFSLRHITIECRQNIEAR